MKFDTFTKKLVFLVFFCMEKVFTMNPELSVWHSVDDVRKFCAYVEEHGEDDANISATVIENTKTAIGGDVGKILPVLTKAMYSVSIVPISTQASNVITEIVNSKKLLSFISIDGSAQIIPDSPKMFNVKLAWMLWCSQTASYGSCPGLIEL